MTRIRNAIGWGSLGVADAVCLALTIAPGAPLNLGALLAAHLGVAACSAALAPLLAPPCAWRHPLAVPFLAAMLAWFIPIFGLFALGVLTTFGPGTRPPRREEPWLTVDVERDADPAVRGTAAEWRGHVGAGAIAAVLRDRSPENAGKRFQALLAARRLPARAAVALCKQALRDPSDEVRLFAFARIERHCDELDARTKTLIAALDRPDDGDRGLFHLRLAEAYWEWAYLRLAEGSVLEHCLHRALEHAAAAAGSRRGRGPAEYLRGRILLALGRQDEAYDALAEALRSGLPRRKVLPYVAECAFRLRRFDAVRATLRELRSSPGEASLRRVAEFWR